ncbi:PINIT domain-containing protein [Choanephora cucurbitarum]|nr:PINIT domain-containing protein [Choanephora cucurbitarum]
MSNYTSQFIESDLKRATCKELADCIKALNSHGSIHGRMTVSGRKGDLVSRLLSFVTSLVINHHHQALEIVVRVFNQTVPDKFHWQFIDEQLYTNRTASRNKPKKQLNVLDQMDFKPSPFLQPVTRLTQIKICPVADGERQARLFQFTLTDSQRIMLATPNAVDDRPPYQIRFYCAKYSSEATNLLVEFPTICELKVNGTVISGSALRCLKNKPGTVNPPDMTIMTRKTALNNVELVYVKSDVPFMASVFIVKRTPVATLIATLKREHILPKEETLAQLQKDQEDNELIMESETLSMKDPLAFTRMVTPIRSRDCRHLQCYDAHTYLTMNEQTPTWSCPVCNRLIHWDDLIVDEYFTEILKNTPKHVDSVRVEPNGQITIVAENDDSSSDEEQEDEEPKKPEKPTPPPTITLDESDDEQVQVPSIAGDQVVVQPLEEQQQETIPAKRPIPILNEQDTNKKQKMSVIDLTLESDEENGNFVDSDEEENVPVKFIR